MIRAAVIGLGWWGQTILKTLLNNTVIAPVLGVDPMDQARAAVSALRIKTTLRFEGVLAASNVDAAIFFTPQQHHTLQIIPVRRPRPPVFCMKPFSTTGAVTYTAIAAG